MILYLRVGIGPRVFASQRVRYKTSMAVASVTPRAKRIPAAPRSLKGGKTDLVMTTWKRPQSGCGGWEFSERRTLGLATSRMGGLRHVHVQIGELEVDSVTFAQALERIAELVDGGDGGAVFTPNVDHVVKAEADVQFRLAYSRASLCLADGTPILWAARLLGSPLPAKVSGSGLVLPLARSPASVAGACTS